MHMLSQWMLALYINIWWCSAICNKNLKHEMWKQFKKTDLTFLHLSESESDMLWLKFNICRHLKLKYTGIHVFLPPQCFITAFFILNIKNITLFYFICRTSCLSILHIALSPLSSGSNPALGWGNKKHLKIFSRLISRSNGLQFPSTWQTHKQTDWPHNIKIQEWAVYKGLLDRLESCVFISQRIWKKDGEKSALHLSHPKQVNEGSRS